MSKTIRFRAFAIIFVALIALGVLPSLLPAKAKYVNVYVMGYGYPEYYPVIQALSDAGIGYESAFWGKNNLTTPLSQFTTIIVTDPGGHCCILSKEKAAFKAYVQGGGGLVLLGGAAYQLNVTASDQSWLGTSSIGRLVTSGCSPTARVSIYHLFGAPVSLGDRVAVGAHEQVGISPASLALGAFAIATWDADHVFAYRYQAAGAGPVYVQANDTTIDTTTYSNLVTLLTGGIEYTLGFAYELASGNAVLEAPYVGTWVNVTKVNSIPEVIVSTTANGALLVHAFGACEPTYCDWGLTPGALNAHNISASYNNRQVGHDNLTLVLMNGGGLNLTDHSSFGTFSVIMKKSAVSTTTTILSTGVITCATTTTSTSSPSASSTTTTSPTTSSPQSTSTASTSPTSSASTSSSGGGGVIPEFPYQVFAAGAFTLLLAVSYVLFRRRPSIQKHGTTVS